MEVLLMALVTGKYLLEKANAGYYAVGAFNFVNMEVLKGISAAAKEENSPALIACSEGAIKYAGIRNLVAMAKEEADSSGMPLCLHLDHGKDFDVIMQCIRNGFTSVMIDGSHLPLEENIAITKKIVEIAHGAGVSVEGELGKLSGIEDNVASRESILTDPVEAERFVKETGVDSLAIAIGTAHGPKKFKGEPILEIPLVAEIKKRTGIPLVLHGASSVPAEVLEKGIKYGAKWEGSKGVPEGSLAEAIKGGINKVNVDTDLRMTFISTLRQVMAEKPDSVDLRDLFKPCMTAVKEVVRHKMRILGSSGKA